jgi:hypothetical protein
LRHRRLSRVLTGLLVCGPLSVFAAEPPPCSELNPQPSQAAIDAAVQQSLTEATSVEALSNWGLRVARAGEILGCVVSDGGPRIFFSGFEQGLAGWQTSATQQSLQLLDTSTINCQEEYCSPATLGGEGVWYCGRGNSQTNPDDFHGKNVSEALNRVCWQHDKCYTRSCIRDNCFFAEVGTQSTSCDSVMLTFCASVTDLVDRMVCGVAAGLQIYSSPFLDRTGCAQAPCGTGAQCIIGASGGYCGTPARWGVCFIGPSHPAASWCSIPLSPTYQCPSCTGIGGCMGPCPPGDPGWSDGLASCGEFIQLYPPC